MKETSKAGKWVLPIKDVFAEKSVGLVTTDVMARQIIASLASYASEHNNHRVEVVEHVKSYLEREIAAVDLLATSVMAQVLGDIDMAKKLRTKPVDHTVRVYGERKIQFFEMAELSQSLFAAYTELLQSGNDQDILALAGGKWPLPVEALLG